MDFARTQKGDSVEDAARPDEESGGLSVARTRGHIQDIGCDKPTDLSYTEERQESYEDVGVDTVGSDNSTSRSVEGPTVPNAPVYQRLTDSPTSTEDRSRSSTLSLPGLTPKPIDPRGRSKPKRQVGRPKRPAASSSESSPVRKRPRPYRKRLTLTMQRVFDQANISWERHGGGIWIRSDWSDTCTEDELIREVRGLTMVVTCNRSIHPCVLFKKGLENTWYGLTTKYNFMISEDCAEHLLRGGDIIALPI